MPCPYNLSHSFLKLVLPWSCGGTQQHLSMPYTLFPMPKNSIPLWMEFFNLLILELL
ncbi:hypothetical protein NIES37_26140 [Tolypothrix tenuis PCC 7101]|uniref:Uncharacterized protein n=1 Tax=Tolypothrix tenuis PCC 7101 TaxID=231146 RepID=A0A1Z4MYV4_9CYAN|nr:hypothetical protein NIES37_26140 [Tolypothrix tenuis PCC 7101]BAZ77420.1 hypothetical protein NIES50_60490 [Aulosira laxa NIES-50]